MHSCHPYSINFEHHFNQYIGFHIETMCKLIHNFYDFSFRVWRQGLKRWFIDLVDTLSFWVLLCQKNLRGCFLNSQFDLNIKSKTFWVFWHNKSQKEIVSNKSISYLILTVFTFIMNVEKREIQLWRTVMWLGWPFLFS